MKPNVCTRGTGMYGLVVLGAAAMLFASPVRAVADCRADAALLQERLEPVIEAAIDHRPAAQAPAVTTAESWWKAHRAASSSPGSMDGLLGDMAKASRAHRTAEAAHFAYEAAVASWRECPSKPSESDHLMMIDLAGMAAWLKSAGQRDEVPAELSKSLDAIGQRLRTVKRAGLASKLAQAGRGVLDPAKTKPVAQRAAVRLLTVVDEVERALLKAVAPAPPKETRG